MQNPQAMPLPELLERLLAAPGPSGHEALTCGDPDGGRWLVRSVWGLVQRVDPAR